MLCKCNVQKPFTFVWKIKTRQSEVTEQQSNEYESKKKKHTKLYCVWCMENGSDREVVSQVQKREKEKEKKSKMRACAETRNIYKSLWNTFNVQYTSSDVGENKKKNYFVFIVKKEEKKKIQKFCWFQCLHTCNRTCVSLFA